MLMFNFTFALQRYVPTFTLDGYYSFHQTDLRPDYRRCVQKAAGRGQQDVLCRGYRYGWTRSVPVFITYNHISLIALT